MTSWTISLLLIIAFMVLIYVLGVLLDRFAVLVDRKVLKLTGEQERDMRRLLANIEEE